MKGPEVDTLETISAQIDTTEEIMSIVRTMKSLSAVSIRQYERAVEALRHYHRTIELGLQAVLRRDVMLFESPETCDGRAAIIVIGSDRGLCGRFNEGVAELAEKKISEEGLYHIGTRPLILALGARVASRLEVFGHIPREIYFLPGSVAGLNKTAQSILIEINRWREQEEVKRIFVIFNRHTEEKLANPASQVLLPVSTSYLKHLATRPWPSRRIPMFTMEQEALFSWLIRQHLYVSIFRAGAESLASEHASRLAAMQAAEHNIGERLENLSQEYRTKRQESITTEMLDIVSGFETMREGDDFQPIE